MTIRSGFLFLFAAFSVWILGCYLCDCAYPRDITPSQLCWTGEIHIGIDTPNPDPIDGEPV